MLLEFLSIECRGLGGNFSHQSTFRYSNFWHLEALEIVDER